LKREKTRGVVNKEPKKTSYSIHESLPTKSKNNRVKETKRRGRSADLTIQISILRVPEKSNEPKERERSWLNGRGAKQRGQKDHLERKIQA